jgi:hypothetical protein
MPFYGVVCIQAILQSEHDMLPGMAGVLGLCVLCQRRRLVVANFLVELLNIDQGLGTCM